MGIDECISAAEIPFSESTRTVFVSPVTIESVPTVCDTVSFCEVTFLQGVSRSVWDSITESRNLKLHVFVISRAW